jgi:4-hydroxy-tetrahydrodipicolinate reductase
MINVGVLGAAGRMGQEVCAAVRAEADLALTAMIDTSFTGDVATAGLGDTEGTGGTPMIVSDQLDAVNEVGVDVAVDFTKADAAVENVKWCVRNGVHVVVGTSGISSDAQGEIANLCSEYMGHVLIAPNFAIGAVLAMKFAEVAATWLPDAEVIEMHHSAKLDSPSGTALNTVDAILRGRKGSPAERPANTTETLGGARGADKEGIHIHSVRLPGLVAHQEVIFGGPGQLLTIRHDSLDRKSFMPGVIVAIREIGRHPGLVVGLETYLGL